MIKFLVDAQLPKKVSLFLISKGYDSIHTTDLVDANHTKDSQINHLSFLQKRVVVSKDMDFIESLLISDKPYKLLYVNTGNIKNSSLLKLFEQNLDEIVTLLAENRLVEITHDSIIVHG